MVPMALNRKTKCLLQKIADGYSGDQENLLKHAQLWKFPDTKNNLVGVQLLKEATKCYSCVLTLIYWELPPLVTQAPR